MMIILSHSKGYLRPFTSIVQNVKGKANFVRNPTTERQLISSSAVTLSNVSSLRLSLLHSYHNTLHRNATAFPLNSSLLTSPTTGVDVTGSALVNQMQIRCYNRRMTAKRPPSKPPKFDYSGDLDYALPPVDSSDPKREYRDIPELDSASDEVKRLFSLAFSDRREILKMQLEDLLDKVKEHPLDEKSLEYKIARYTILIRNQIQHMANGHHKDKVGKSLLIRRIQARKKFMRRLRSSDFEKFEWLCEQLQIKYTVPPYFIWSRFEGKRAKRKRVAREACLAEKAMKMKLFEEKLAEEKAIFLEQKEADLKQIEQDLKELGIDDDMSDLNTLLSKLNVEGFLPVKEDRRTMRQKLLEKKFELYGTNKKKGAAYRHKVVVT